MNQNLIASTIFCHLCTSDRMIRWFFKNLWLSTQKTACESMTKQQWWNTGHVTLSMFIHISVYFSEKTNCLNEFSAENKRFHIWKDQYYTMQKSCTSDLAQENEVNVVPALSPYKSLMIILKVIAWLFSSNQYWKYNTFREITCAVSNYDSRVSYLHPW